MDFTPVRGWLEQKVRREARMHCLAGVGGLAASALVLCLTFWLVYAVVLLIYPGLIRRAYRTAYWIAGGFVMLLFLGNARASRESLADISLPTTDGKKPHPGNVYVSPAIVTNMAKIFTDILYFGPRLVAGSVRAFRKASRLARLDCRGCAAVLAVLAAHAGRMPYPDIVSVIEGINPVTLFPQLAEIEGVVFLSEEPPGLSLTTELRKEVQVVLRRAKA